MHEPLSQDAPVNVDLVSRDVENLLGGADDNAEGFVDFEQRNILDLEPGLLKSQRKSNGWGGGEVHRSDSSIGIGCNDAICSSAWPIGSSFETTHR